MKSLQYDEGKTAKLTSWCARALGLLTTGLFLFIIILVVINEDPPRVEAVPMLVLLVVAILGALMGWRWERVGGAVLIISALALVISIYANSSAFGLGPVGLLLGLMIYSLPPLVTGGLYLLSARRH